MQEDKLRRRRCSSSCNATTSHGTQQARGDKVAAFDPRRQHLRCAQPSL